jgi:hypothetical protein
MSTALPWLPPSSSSPLLSSLPPPAPNTTIPKDMAVLSHAIGFHRLKPFAKTSASKTKSPPQRLQCEQVAAPL